MKASKIQRIIAATLSVVFLSSVNGCVDITEETPGQLTTASVYKTQRDFDAAVVGLYAPLFGGYAAFDFDWPIVMTGGGEDVDSQALIFSMFDEMRADPGSGAISSMWASLYKSINNANNIIGNINNVPASEARNRVEGQARFMRALDYFFLTRWFGEIQLITYDNQPDAATVVQSPVSDIYDFIVEDLKIAEQLLPISFGEQSAQPGKGAATGLLAKVYLTMAGWPVNKGAVAYQLARDKAAELIDGQLSGQYTLEQNFGDLWPGDNKFNREFMFILNGAATSGDNASRHHIATRHPDDGGWGDWYSEERFLNSFPDGPRKDATFRLTFSTGKKWNEVNVPGGGAGQPFSAKYRNSGPECSFEATTCPSAGSGFFPVLRYADILLIYAEAANLSEGNPSALAYEAINKVRRRAAGMDANTPSPEVDLSGLSFDDFDKAVLDERNWELAFEANRWFDLTRRELVEQVNGSIYNNVTRDDYYLPKPLVQVEISSGLKQNPGY